MVKIGDQGVHSAETNGRIKEEGGFRELRDHVEAIRSRLLHVPDVSEIEVLGAQDEQIFIEFSAERLAGSAAATAGGESKSRGERVAVGGG